MFLGRDLFDEKDYSEETARKIDEEIHNLVHESYEKAKKLLLDHRDKMDLLARRLIEKETIDIEEPAKDVVRHYTPEATPLRVARVVSEFRAGRPQNNLYPAQMQATPRLVISNKANRSTRRVWQFLCQR